MDDEFRRTVLDWLERRGWNQARLAAAAELSQSLVSKHLSDETRKRVRPSPANLRRYAPVLGIPYEELMRMTGYLLGVPSVPSSDPIEDDVRARTRELLNAVKGAPPVFWPIIIKATYDQAVGDALNMVGLLKSVESERSADRARQSAADEAPEEPSNRGKKRVQRPINPRHPAFALST